AYAESNITTTVTPAAATGLLSHTFYSVADLGTPLAGAPIDAGDYVVKVHFASDNPSAYTDADGQAAFKIAKADAIIGINNYSGPYDGATHGLTGTATGVESPTPADLSGLLTLGATYTNAGSYTATWSFAGNDNY